MDADARRSGYRKVVPAAISAVIVGACLAALAALLYRPALEVLLKTEHWTADWRTAFLSDRIAGLHSDIVVVVFNSDTLVGRPSALTVPRDLHGQVIQAIDAAGARAIGLDFYFVHPTQPEADRKFLEVLRTTKAPLVVGAANESADQFKDFQLAYQRTFTADSGRAVGYNNLRQDRDDVVRFTSTPIPNTAYPESLDARLVQVSGIEPRMRATSAPSRRIAWLWGGRQNPQPFLTIPAQDLLAASSDHKKIESLAQIAGKVVLTGIDLPYIDRFRTPLSIQTGTPMLGVMIHAQILAQIIDGRGLHDLSHTGDLLILVVVALVGLVLGWHFWQRRANFLSLGAATAVLVGIDVATFSLFRTVLPLTLALYAWFVAVTAGHHLRKLWQGMIASRPGA
jgi:adenylate cyclase